MKIVTMGEMMLRLMPRNNLRFEQATEFEAYYGGDESIVAVSLAKMGMQARYVTKLPLNPIADTAIGKLREQNVDTSFIVRGGDRMGINFYENGASVRASNVVYDRKYSAISQAEPDEFDWDGIFGDAGWFHIAGITPAISEKASALTERAMKEAKAHGATVSVDLNYRGKLWSPERAREVMVPLMKYVDVCIGNEEDADKVLGFRPENTDITKGQLDVDAYKDVFRRLKETFGFKYIGSTLRESWSASDNGWSVLIYDGEKFCHSREYKIHLVDRGGGGASFAAGMIYGILNGMTLEETAEYAAAASALKQTITGDFNLATADEIRRLAGGDASGRVRR
ncbi:MAG: sugar kinase [Clostridia bacterium]|nr:sugar kinase [Clostridia bacterium]